MKVCIYGTGAVGGYFGGRLAQAGCCRRNENPEKRYLFNAIRC